MVSEACFFFGRMGGDAFREVSNVVKEPCGSMFEGFTVMRP